MSLSYLYSKIHKIYFVGLFSVLASFYVQAANLPVLSPERLQLFAKSPQWQYLLQIRPGPISSKKSRIKGTSKYFISPMGSLDPLAELEASIEVFQNPQHFIDTRGQHPNCLFPARLQILQRTLNLQVPAVDCPALEHWKQLFRHDEVVLAFASQYLSSPSSMMGHTFLKFKNAHQQDFMNLTTGYAASVPENAGAFQYVQKGLFGGFIGRFSRQPYYEKVHEYNNMEQRDLWEFVLNLNLEQRTLLLEHLWELQTLADFDYYFIDENCAFMLLAAIQVTIPETDILDHFPIYVLPAEIAKNLDRVGLIKEVIYRPSLAQKLKHKYGLPNSQEQKNVFSSFTQHYVNDPLTALGLETLLEKISLERHSHNGELRPELMALEKQALLQRSRFGPIDIPAVPIPESGLKSHSPMHIEWGGGQSTLDQSYSLVTLRPAIHKLVDKDIGYLKNSAFNLMELELISKVGLTEIKLNRLVIAEISVSPPYQQIDPAISWQLKLEHRRETDSLCLGCNLSIFEGGMGATFRIFGDSLDIIPLLYTELQVGPEIPQSRLWLGPKIDFIFNSNNKWKWRQNFNFRKNILNDQTLTETTSLTEMRFFDFQPHWDLGLTWLSHFHSENILNDQDLSLRLIHDF